MDSPLWGRRRHPAAARGSRTRLRSVMPEAPPATATATSGRGRKKGGEGDPWEGHKHGFDWQLERARRTLEGPAFAPFRMDYWKPPTVRAGVRAGAFVYDGI